jgi:hypothetical protein
MLPAWRLSGSGWREYLRPQRRYGNHQRSYKEYVKGQKGQKGRKGHTFVSFSSPFHGIANAIPNRELIDELYHNF